MLEFFLFPKGLSYKEKQRLTQIFRKKCKPITLKKNIVGILEINSEELFDLQMFNAQREKEKVERLSNNAKKQAEKRKGVKKTNRSSLPAQPLLGPPSSILQTSECGDSSQFAPANDGLTQFERENDGLKQLESANDNLTQFGSESDGLNVSSAAEVQSGQGVPKIVEPKRASFFKRSLIRLYPN